MKFPGFIGAAYQLDSVNVDAQRCVNLYPEAIESGFGKEGQVAYLRGTPGLRKIASIGDGPIRCIHTDSIGRIFVVSGAKVYHLAKDTIWKIAIAPTEALKNIAQNTAIDETSDQITVTDHGLYTGLKVRVSSSGTIPTGLAEDTDYWVIVVDDNTFQLASSLSNAVNGVAVDITNKQTGNLTVTPQAPSSVASVNLDDIDPDTNEFICPAHGFYTGLRIQFTAVTNESGGVVPLTYYYVIKVDDDTFQIAESIEDAEAETAFDIGEVGGEWTYGEVGSQGTRGGDPVTLATSSGIVKAASMSRSGDGTDSSTAFVDGFNNYLYENGTGGAPDTFEALGDLQIAKVTYDELTYPMTVYISKDPSEHAGKEIIFTIDERSSGGELTFQYLGYESLFIIKVNNYTGVTLTTAELVEFLNTQSITGRTVSWKSPNGVPANFFAATGGGPEGVKADLLRNNSSSTPKTFTLDTLSGGEYSPVNSATDITWIDGYFIVNEGGTNRFFVSDLDSFNINTLSFASAEASPDLVLAVAANNRNLWVFNEKSIEIYVNTGNADFPFERVQGGFLDVGCLAKYSVAQIDGTLFWLGRTKDGHGRVYAASGMSYKRISTHAIEQVIKSYGSPSSAVAYAYQDGGHSFYVLNFDEATWVYDLTTGLWHERAYFRDGSLERHRANFHTYSSNLGLHIVGDYATNDVYILDDTYYKDGDDEIVRLRAFPHISGGYKRVFCHKLQLDMETGIGLDGGVQGSNPTVMLDWSDDGGHTWSSEQFALADAGSGQIGEYKTRVIWRRLGSFRDRVFRIKITDPVKVRLINVDIEAEVGVS